MIKTIVPTVFAVLFGCSVAAAQLELLPDAIEAVRPTIAQIRVTYKDGTQSFGTGFFVNKQGYVITAAHVITAPANKSLMKISVATKMPTILAKDNSGGMTMVGNFAGSPAAIVAVDASHDIALLLPSSNPFAGSNQGVFVEKAKLKDAPIKFVEFASKAVRDGDSIFISGFPSVGNSALTTTSGRIASSDAYATNTQTGKAEGYYMADIHINPGNSGGPVFSGATHSVIGVCVSYQPAPVKFTDTQDQALGVRPQSGGGIGLGPLGENSGIANIIPVQHVIDILNANRVSYSTRPQPKQGTKGPAMVKGKPVAPVPPSTHRP